MANDLNKVFLLGRLTRDPEFKTINTTSLVTFGLANNRVTVVNGEKKEEVHYFECEAWGKLAEIIRQYAKKGKQVLIEGRLKYETWESQDGRKNSRVRIVLENMQLLGSQLQDNREVYPNHKDEVSGVGLKDTSFGEYVESNEPYSQALNVYESNDELDEPF